MANRTADEPAGGKGKARVEDAQVTGPDYLVAVKLEDVHGEHEAGSGPVLAQVVEEEEETKNGGSEAENTIATLSKKTRLTWSKDLQDKFEEAVDSLGGPYGKFLPHALFLLLYFKTYVGCYRSKSA